MISDSIFAPSQHLHTTPTHEHPLFKRVAALVLIAVTPLAEMACDTGEESASPSDFDVSDDELVDMDVNDIKGGEDDSPAAQQRLAHGDSDSEALSYCSGNACNGVDPMDTNCYKDAFTASTRSIYGITGGKKKKIGYVQLRWSPTCRTNWSRVTRTDGYWGEGMVAYITRSDGLKKSDFHEGYTTIWSPMVYAPSPYCAKAGALIDYSVSSGNGTTPCY